MISEGDIPERDDGQVPWFEAPRDPECMLGDVEVGQDSDNPVQEDPAVVFHLQFGLQNILPFVSKVLQVLRDLVVVSFDALESDDYRLRG